MMMLPAAKFSCVKKRKRGLAKIDFPVEDRSGDMQDITDTR